MFYSELLATIFIQVVTIKFIAAHKKPTKILKKNDICKRIVIFLKNT